MASGIRGKVLVTPIVTIAADDDGNAKDVIHHDIKHTLGCKFEVYSDTTVNGNVFTGTARWYYEASRNVTTTRADLLNTSVTFTDGTSPVDDDDVVMLYVENLGIDSNGNETDAITLIAPSFVSGGSPSLTRDEHYILESKESGIWKFHKSDQTVEMPSVGCIEVTSGNDNVNIKIVALVDDN